MRAIPLYSCTHCGNVITNEDLHYSTVRIVRRTTLHFESLQNKYTTILDPLDIGCWIYCFGFPSWMVRQFGFSDSGGDIGSDISSTSPYSVSVAMQVPQSNDEERER
ncbi:uncharacterized protein LOC125500005 isoform X1 [Athalia rosae]|uniref:uncharacterized protein LOC125500005 isoform X1 n=1 Tax=Athalia rosae TaxID=37344 RepID=UPI002033E3A4|nr:uncharacterized protein LOC125500005 isoform X1 [Athalia rosae]